MHSLNYKWNQKKLAKSEEVHKSQKPAFHAFAFWTSSSQTTSSQNRPSSFTAVFDIYDTQLQYLPSTLKYALEMAKTSPKPESFGRLFFLLYQRPSLFLYVLLVRWATCTVQNQDSTPQDSVVITRLTSSFAWSKATVQPYSETPSLCRNNASFRDKGKRERS